MPKINDRISEDKFQLILRVGQAFNSVIEIDRLFELIASTTSRLLEAERCSIYVVDTEQNTLWTRAAEGENRIAIPIGVGIAGAVAESGEYITVDDAYEDPRFNHEIDRETGYRTKSLIAGPLINNTGEIIGVIQVLNVKKGNFSIGDEQLLRSLSGFAGNALENALLYDELKTTFHSVLQVLAATIDAKHHYTAGHTARVADYSCGIGREMSLSEDELEILRVAAFLHDYGKIAIRDNVLTKPGKLSDEEYEEMKSHAMKTSEILSKMHFSAGYKEVPLIAGAHHEKYDGSGYPAKLSNDDIPLGARIMAVADVFDALTSDRDYRKAMKPHEALELIRKEVGTSFDPKVFAAFESYFNRRYGPLGDS